MSARLICAMAVIAALAAPATAFEVNFDFSNVRACAGGALRITPSPEFRLTDVPAGTATLDFALQDLTIGLAHGGRKLAYTGEASIAADSFKYVGPCPVKARTATSGPSARSTRRMANSASPQRRAISPPRAEVHYMLCGPREMAASPVRTTSTSPSGCIRAMKLSILAGLPVTSNTKLSTDASTICARKASASRSVSAR
jgi:hypothetical protein